METWFGIALIFCAVYLLNVSVFQKYTELIRPVYLMSRPAPANLTDYISLPPKNTDDCTVLKEFGSSEDAKIDPTGKYLYSVHGSVASRLNYFPPANRRNASMSLFEENIVFYDLHTETLQNLEITGYDQPLIAHGLDVRVDSGDSNARLLYIINHLEDGSVVSIFNHTVGTKQARHVYDVKNDLIYAPNSLTTVSENGFFITNDHLFHKGMLRDLEEFYGPLRWSNVVYCSFDFDDDGELDDDTELSAAILHRFPRCKASAHGFSYANGIAYNKKNDKVFVADSRLGEIKVFSRNTKYDTLSLEKTVTLGAAPDNIAFAPNNDLIISTIPNPLVFDRKAEDPFNPEEVSPIAVIILKVSEAYSTPHLLFWDNGVKFGGVTGSAYDANHEKLYLTSLIDTGMLVCKIKSY